MAAIKLKKGTSVPSFPTIVLRRRKSDEAEDSEVEDREPEPEQSNGNDEEKIKEKRRKAAEYQRLYRLKKKDDPDYKQKEKGRKKRQWLKISSDPVKKTHNAQLQKVRNQRYMAKLKDKGVTQERKKPKKPQTRAIQEKDREYNRLRKQAYRKSLSAQKKRRIKEKDKLAKASKKATKKATESTKSGESNNENESADVSSVAPFSAFSTSLSKQAVKQAAYRVRMSMPASPGKFSEVIEHIIDNATPRKRESLNERGIVSSSKGEHEYINNLKALINDIKKKRCQKSNYIRNALACAIKATKKARKLAISLGMNYKYVQKCTDSDEIVKTTRSDSTSAEIIHRVEQYYSELETASFVPDRKSVSKKDIQPIQVLNQPVRSAYKTFIKQNPEIKLSLTKFHQLRPSHVKPSTKKKLYQSLCEPCSNARYLVGTLNHACRDLNINYKIEGLYDLIDKVTCPKGEEDTYHKLECLKQINKTHGCVNCGVNKLDGLLQDITIKLEHLNKRDEFKWKCWTTQEYQSAKGTSKKKVQQQVCGTAKELVTKLKSAAKFICYHLFVSSWQQSNFSKLTKDIPEGTVIVHSDFSENYSTFYQDEIGSAHWMKNLVTIHPSVAYYNCPTCPFPSPIMEAIVHISGDNQHDHHAVQTFTVKTINFLRSEREIDVLTYKEFTDGCAGQYKSRGPFVDISYGFEDFGLQRERHFFESYHGKGPSDGAGAVVKTALRRAVVRGNAIITNAEQIYNYLNENFSRPAEIDGLCNHSRRHFIFTSPTDILRDRPEREIKTTLRGTMEVHSIRSVSPGVVCTRLLTCSCTSCLGLEPTPCENIDYVKDWSVKRLNLKRMQVPRVLPRNINQNNETEGNVTDVDDALDRLGNIGEDLELHDQNAENIMDVDDAIHRLGNIAEEFGLDDQNIASIMDLDDAIHVADDIGIDDQNTASVLEVMDLGPVELPKEIEIQNVDSDMSNKDTEYVDGQFVLVKLATTRGKTEHYVAQIDKVVDREFYELNFLEKDKSVPGWHRWPKRKDWSEETKDRIIKSLAEPEKDIVTLKDGSKRDIFKFLI